MKTSYTLSEVKSIIQQIQSILLRDSETNYNNLVMELRYYTRLAQSLKEGN